MHLARFERFFQTFKCGQDLFFTSQRKRIDVNCCYNKNDKLNGVKSLIIVGFTCLLSEDLLSYLRHNCSVCFVEMSVRESVTLTRMPYFS